MKIQLKPVDTLPGYNKMEFHTNSEVLAINLVTLINEISVVHTSAFWSYSRSN